MSTSLTNCMTVKTSNFTDEDGYRVYIESHLKYLREHPDTQLITLNQDSVYKNLYDFSSLFMDLGINIEDHWLVLRLNNYTSFKELTMEVIQLWLPPANVVNRLKQMYRTVSGRV